LNTVSDCVQLLLILAQATAVARDSKDNLNVLASILDAKTTVAVTILMTGAA
jgi:hypothetical protein